MKFEDPSIPIGVRHICALVPDVPKVAQELSQQDVEVVRPLAQNSLGLWYTMIRDPIGWFIVHTMNVGGSLCHSNRLYPIPALAIVMASS
jgi:hypothetical protein